jgi:asparagine N-glycosylation enzyme membrane subunit Stt3
LTLILAPALCLLWALALSRILRPFVTLLREAPVTLRRKTRFATRVGKEFSAIPLILIFLLLTITFIFPSTESRLRGDPFPRVIDQAYIPTSIAAAGLPVAIRDIDALPDWLDALDWMRNNLPADAVVASWWDYGYWITTIANKTTLVDNATLNTTQIKRVGLMFMSPETEATAILDEFNEEAHSRGFSSNVTYVVAFLTFDTQGRDVGYGEEGKWKWMANIAFDNLEEWKTYGNYTLGNDAIDTDGDGQLDQLVDNSKGQNTTLYKMMMWGKSQRVSVTAVEPEHFELVYYSQKGWSTVVTAGSVHALVTVWKVIP